MGTAAANPPGECSHSNLAGFCRPIRIHYWVVTKKHETQPVFRLLGGGTTTNFLESCYFRQALSEAKGKKKVACEESNFFCYLHTPTAMKVMSLFYYYTLLRQVIIIYLAPKKG